MSASSDPDGVQGQCARTPDPCTTLPGASTIAPPNTAIPVHDAGLLESFSPLRKVDRIVCPMFVAQGLTDPRVPPHESEQIVDTLRRRAVPVEYVTFADEGHGFLKRDNRRRVYLGVADFLSRRLLHQGWQRMVAG